MAWVVRSTLQLTSDHHEGLIIRNISGVGYFNFEGRFLRRFAFAIFSIVLATCLNDSADAASHFSRFFSSANLFADFRSRLRVFLLLRKGETIRPILP
jgi:hypothetical protein